MALAGLVDLTICNTLYFQQFMRFIKCVEMDGLQLLLGFPRQSEEGQVHQPKRACGGAYLQVGSNSTRFDDWQF